MSRGDAGRGSGAGSTPADGVVVPVPAAGPGAYRVEVRSGGLDLLGRRCRERVAAHRYVVISDRRVADRYADRALESLREAGARAELLTFPEGEASKSREQWSGLTDGMLRAGLGRDAAVVALGGGVTGDLAGFVAATYMRGVPVVQVPTSLLAMLDSSVGGKTGLNTPGGKNLVGAFHHPAHVLVDPEVLATLDGREIRAGLAEAVKAAAIADGDLFRWMEGHAGELAEGRPEPTGELIRRSVAIKADVVARDPEEHGRRAVLNFGHTLGHAMEAAAGYGGLHGEAVAAGMCMEAGWGQSEGVTEEGTAARLRSLVRACGIRPWPADRHDPEEILRAVGRDKKARRDGPRMVLLEEVGSVARPAEGEWTHAVDEESLRSWLPGALRSEADAAL